MNRFSMLAKGPKATTRVFSPGEPPSVPTPGVRKPREVGITPQAASTRMYGKAEPAPGADMFGANPGKKSYV